MVLKRLSSLILGLIVFAHLANCRRTATLVNNGLETVLVSISSEIEANDKPTMDSIVQLIKNLINNASIELYNATGNRVYFNKVNITVPTNWVQYESRGDITVVSPVDQSTFEKADIRLDIPNAAFGDIPYVQQSKGCGVQGDFIHITQNFLNGVLPASYGSPARLLAREWIKYYFGVFDEQGYDFSTLYPPMYYKPDGQTDVTMCNTANVNYKVNTCSGTSSVAGILNSCQIEVDATQGEGSSYDVSLMALPLVPVAERVCNDTNHNFYSPSKHNIMCDGKSVLNVILSNKQFQNQQNVPSNAPKPIATNIEVTQVSSSIRMALYVIWDIQDNDKNLFSGGPAMSKFIETDLPDGSYFGFTSTENDAESKVFAAVNTQSDRDAVVAAIKPTKSTFTGGNIITAVQTAINKLDSIPESQYWKSMLIVTNNTDSTKWSGVCDSVNSKSMEIHLITYVSESVNSYIKAKCEGTQIIVKATDQSRYSGDISIQQCYTQLQERQQTDRFLRTLPSVILPNLYTPSYVYKDIMYTTPSANGSFTIDDPKTTSVSSNFYVETCQNLAKPYEYDALIDCTVGNVKCSSNDKSATLATCMDVPLDNATQWNYECVQHFSDKTVPFVVTAVGKAKAVNMNTDKQLIQFKSWVDTQEEPNSKYVKVIIFASLKQGTTPVLNAKVIATITSDTAKNLTAIVLRDDGNGNPDITSQDGVYSAYFTQFGTSTAYSVNVRASDNNGAASVPTKQYEWISHINNMELKPTGTFSRESPAGSFVGISNGGTDDIEPGRIMDLKVESTSSESVTLAWTAPGDNLDYGTATKYLIKCGTDPKALSSDFGNNDQDPSIPTINPASALTKQTVTISGSADGITHYCAIQTYDEKSQSSKPSNIVSYSIVAGSNAAQTAGIALGVIFGVLAVVAVFLLIWCCYCKKTKTTETNGKSNGNEVRPTSTSPDYKPVPQVDNDSDRPMIIYKPSYKTENETVQLQSSGLPSNKNGSHASLKVDSFDTTATTAIVKDSRSPSPKSHTYTYKEAPPTMNMYGNYTGHSIDDDDDDDVVAESAEVAIPQVLTKIATIENTKKYHDSPKIPPKPPTVMNYNKLLQGPNNSAGQSRNAQV